MTLYPDLSDAIGQCFRDAQGMTWQLTAQSEDHYPYWSQVNAGKLGTTLYCLADGERIAIAMLRRTPTPALL